MGVEITKPFCSFDDSKKIVTMKSLMNDCYRFNMRCMFPAVVPIHYALLYMLQSGNYILTPEFITNYKKVDFEEASALWQIVHDPKSTCISMIMKLVFDSRSYGKKVSALF